MPARPLYPASSTDFYTFYYGSIASFWTYWLVDPAVIDRHLQGTGLRAARFTHKRANGKALPGQFGLANLDLMNYASHLGAQDPFPAKGAPTIGVEATNEAEFNVCVVPDAWANRAPDDLDVETFLTAGDITKTIGHYRLFVPCDDPIAVDAGKQYFGENKFLAKFAYTVPCLNSSTAAKWTYRVLDWKAKGKGDYICDVACDVADLPFVPGNSSELLDVSLMADPAKAARGKAARMRPVVSRRNNLGVYRTWMLHGAAAQRIQLRTGPSAHPMKALLKAILGDGHPVAAQSFESQTPVAEGRPIWADIE